MRGDNGARRLPFAPTNLAPTGPEHHLSSRPRCHPSAACQVVPGAQKCCDRNTPTATCRLKNVFFTLSGSRAKQFTNGQPQESCGWQCLAVYQVVLTRATRHAVPRTGWRERAAGFLQGGDQGCGALRNSVPGYSMLGTLALGSTERSPASTQREDAEEEEIVDSIF